MTHEDWSERTTTPPGRPREWFGPLREIDRWEWRADAEPGHEEREGQQRHARRARLHAELARFLAAHGLAGPFAEQGGSTGVVLLVGARAAARLAGLAEGARSPVPRVPDLVAVAVRAADGAATAPRLPLPHPTATPGEPRDLRLGEWRTSWTDRQHAEAVDSVRTEIARGEVYQVNVVGHRSTAHRARPVDIARRVAALPASYPGFASGDGWAVGCASPEQLVRVSGGVVTTRPVKGTAPDDEVGRAALRASAKERAEHVMIVDLERNDLSRLAVTGSVDVAELYTLSPWAHLAHAHSTVTARLRPDVGVLDVLSAVVPGGSVTGAPKAAACDLLARLEPVGRGPSMGAFGFLWPGGLDLGLTIRTVAADNDSVHLWAGGGITWDSDAEHEVAEAHAKAAPLVAALSRPAR